MDANRFSHTSYSSSSRRAWRLFFPTHRDTPLENETSTIRVITLLEEETSSIGVITVLERKNFYHTSHYSTGRKKLLPYKSLLFWKEQTSTTRIINLPTDARIRVSWLCSILRGIVVRPSIYRSFRTGTPLWAEASRMFSFLLTEVLSGRKPG